MLGAAPRAKLDELVKKALAAGDDGDGRLVSTTRLQQHERDAGDRAAGDDAGAQGLVIVDEDAVGGRIGAPAAARRQPEEQRADRHRQHVAEAQHEAQPQRDARSGKRPRDALVHDLDQQAQHGADRHRDARAHVQRAEPWVSTSATLRQICAAASGAFRW